MIHSITGYAAATRDFGRGTLSLELKSVNSRFLDIGFRISPKSCARSSPSCGS